MQFDHARRSWLSLSLLALTLAACSSSEDEPNGDAQVCMSEPCICMEGSPSCPAPTDAQSSAAPSDAGTASSRDPVTAAASDSGARPSGPIDAGAPGRPDATSGAPMGSPDATVSASAPSSGCGNATPPPAGSTMIDVDGMQRSYIVKLPAEYDASKPHRLVFAWHGLGGTAMQIAGSFYGLAARAGNSAIFIAPQGLPNPQQNNLAAWANTGDRDVSFTRKVLDWAKANYCIDSGRVFSIGMSNGGMMSNIVGCELGDSIRAIAAMSGGGPRGYAMKPCVGQVAVWISHGSRDNNVPFSYGQMSRDYWVKTNGCGMETMPAMPGSCLEYQGCDPGFPVQFCEFDGGHMVPAFTGEAAWKFFERL